MSSEQRKRARARVKNKKELPCRRLQTGTARNSSGLKGARNNVQSMYSIGKQKKKWVERCHMQRGRKVPLERNVACDMNPIVFPHQNSSGSSKVLKKTTRLARGAVELYRGAKHRRFAMLGVSLRRAAYARASYALASGACVSPCVAAMSLYLCLFFILPPPPPARSLKTVISTFPLLFFLRC